MKAFQLLFLLAALVPSLPLGAAPLSLLGSDTKTGPSSTQVTFSASAEGSSAGAIDVKIEPGKEGYPGVSLKSPTAVWDLKEYGHVSAKITNTGSEKMSIALRIDESKGQGNAPWNAENLYLQSGESGTVKVIFGHSYGHKQSYPFKSHAVAQVLIFTSASKATQSFRIDSVVADGPADEKAPIDPNTIRTKPEAGKLYAKGMKLDPAKQLKLGEGTTAEATADGLRVTLSPKAKEGIAMMLKPEVGRWVLSDYLEVRVKLKNVGTAPVTPLVSVEGNGRTESATTNKPMEPGASAELVVPFASDKVWDGLPNTGSRIASDVVSGVILAAKVYESERALLVESVTAVLPPTPKMPEWVGKQPPASEAAGNPADWVMTLDDNFEGTDLNEKIWAWSGPNHWDKVSHWSRENVIIGDGVAKLRYTKKTGTHNDDPKGKKTDYASGFLETYGKWVQRYGYFETRIKLPTAPGLWPAFWMLPDRGVKSNPSWVREATGAGGMEFDMVEHLTRWGPNRYNVAFHWDGYQKDHKATGTDKIYAQPDKDGFMTVGMLWVPGKVEMYNNGVLVARWENDRISNVATRMMFTLVSGGWDNDELDDARLPADLIIDYVRVWQRKDLASEVDGYQPPAAKP